MLEWFEIRFVPGYSFVLRRHLPNPSVFQNSVLEWFEIRFVPGYCGAKNLEIYSRDFLFHGTQGESNGKGVGKTFVCPFGVTEVFGGLEGGSPIECIRSWWIAGRSTPLGLQSDEKSRNHSETFHFSEISVD